MAPGERPIVLVVDDDPIVLRSTARVLAREYDVEPFESPRALLARASAGPVAAVVTDMRMPEMNGFELATALHALDPALPIVMVSATGAEDDAADAVARGVSACLAKPFGPGELLAAVEAALTRAASTERRPSSSRSRSAG